MYVSPARDPSGYLFKLMVFTSAFKWSILRDDLPTSLTGAVLQSGLTVGWVLRDVLCVGGLLLWFNMLSCSTVGEMGWCASSTPSVLGKVELVAAGKGLLVHLSLLLEAVSALSACPDDRKRTLAAGFSCK